MGNIGEWIEKNPWLAGAIGVGGVIVIWWLFFSGSSSSSSSANTGQTNLAAAYYAAEAGQTQASTDLQIAQTQAAAQTAQYQIQGNTAATIAATEGTTQTTLGAQSAGVETVDANDNLAATQSTNAMQLAINNNNNTAAELTNYVNTVFPTELAQQTTSGAQGFVAATPFGSFNINTGGFAPNINDLIGMGYTPEQADALAGVA